ncbi:C39 family peptidase, partial [bacterium]|nr:C39 family peptidase [bacterium]
KVSNPEDIKKYLFNKDGFIEKYKSYYSDLKTVPEKVDLCDKLPKVASQRYQGSCVAWAAGYYYKTYQEAKERDWSVDINDPKNICSPAFLYNQINGGNDDGSFPLDAMKVLRTMGCASLEDFPYNPADSKTLPDRETMKKALSFRGDSFYFFYSADNHFYTGKRVTPVSNEKIDELKTHLANGDLFILSIPIYSSFYNITNGVYNPTDAQTTQQEGGHAIVVCGYDNEKNSFKIRNSWGDDWGISGDAYLSYDFVKNYSQEAVFMLDRVNYQPTKYFELLVTGVKRSLLKFMLLGFDGGSPEFDFLIIDSRENPYFIIDASDINFFNGVDGFLLNLFDYNENRIEPTIEIASLYDWSSETPTLSFNNSKIPDGGDIDFTNSIYKSIHYDKNDLESFTYGEKDGYIAVEFAFENSGEIVAIDTLKTDIDASLTLMIYDTYDIIDGKLVPKNLLWSSQNSDKKSGWFTKKLDSPIFIEKNERKIVVLKGEHPSKSVLPVDSFTKLLIFATTFYSNDGKNFEPITENGKIRVRFKEVDVNPHQSNDSGCSINFDYKNSSNFIYLLLSIFIISIFLRKYRKI